MIQYVIFDLDDTLLDFKRGEIEGVTKLLKKYHAPDISKGLSIYLKTNKKFGIKLKRAVIGLHC